jgi:hypothetical protein
MLLSIHNRGELILSKEPRADFSIEGKGETIFVSQ